MIKKTTYTRAFEACERFFADTGQMPTIETIKPIIGVNSPSIISSAIKDWKASLANTVRTGQGINPGVPKALLEAAETLWNQALEEANRLFTEQQDALETKGKILDTREQSLLEEATRIGELVSVTEQKFAEEISYLNKEIDRLTRETSTAKAEADQHRAIATVLEKNNAVLAEEIRQEKEKFHRLETQYDREHDWALKRIEEEKESHRQHTQHEMGRLQAETTRHKQAADMAQTKQEYLSRQLSEFRDMIALLEGNLSKETLKIAELTLDKANLQSELNEKDETIRLLLAKKNRKNQ